MGRTLLLLPALWLALPAAAAEMRYEVFWGGFRAAEARLSQSENGAELTARATGLVDRFATFALEAERHAGQFRTHSRGRSWESLLAVDFAGVPRTVIDEIRRAEPEKEPRPPVPEVMKAGTVDPLTALVSGSRRILDSRPGERFSIPVFDGRNRYDVAVTVEAAARARAEIVPLAGFRRKSRDTWDGAAFTVHIDPSTRLPAKIVSDTFAIGTVVMALPPTPVGG